MNRRAFLGLGAGAAVASAAASARCSGATDPAQSPGLPLESYSPQSMLRVAETKVERSRFAVIDFHTHITEGSPHGTPGSVELVLDPATCLATMERRNVYTMVCLTGGYGQGLRNSAAKLSGAYPGRFVVFTEPAWELASDRNYPQRQAELIEEAHRNGARGIKVLKTLGLFLRDPVSHQLVAIDDKRFDPMWDVAGSLGIPVTIHSSDPEAFFLPVDKNNERWEELHAHPDWSFHGADFPASSELHEARRRVMRRHPRTQFVCAHVACAEDLSYVSECLDSHPNMHVDIAARIGELGRQSRNARRFFLRYQDRIVFGTDASAGDETPQQTFCDALYQIYFRFLETEDEYFDYAPARIPPQGRWRISGVGLPEEVLRKVYWQNAATLLGIS